MRALNCRIAQGSCTVFWPEGDSLSLQVLLLGAPHDSTTSGASLVLHSKRLVRHSRHLRDSMQLQACSGGSCCCMDAHTAASAFMTL